MDYRNLIAGCSGCAGRRAAASAWWAGIDPTKAINLDSARSATERRGDADLMGGASVGMMSVAIKRNPSGDGDAWTVSWNEFRGADFADLDDESAQALKVVVFEDDVELFTVLDNDFFFDFPSAIENNETCRFDTVATPAGYTEVGWSDPNTGVTTDIDTGAVIRIKVLNKSTSAVVRDYQGLLHCLTHTTGEWFKPPGVG